MCTHTQEIERLEQQRQQQQQQKDDAATSGGQQPNAVGQQPNVVDAEREQQQQLIEELALSLTETDEQLAAAMAGKELVSCVACSRVASKTRKL